MKRNIEDEIVKLETIIRENGEKISDKLAKLFFKQIDNIRKCSKPKKANRERNQNQNSGLLKNVQISPEMAKFANWKADELHSRRDVTNKICEYIKNKQLQKPGNGKIILPDHELCKLLAWDSNNECIRIKYIKSEKGDGDQQHDAKQDAHIFDLISLGPLDIQQKDSYYTSSDLVDNSKNIHGIVKSFAWNDKQCHISFKDETKLALNEEYTLYVPLTYPRIQTKIGIHFPKNQTTTPSNEPKPSKKKK